MFLWVDTQRKDRLRRTDTEKQTERQRVRHTDRRTDRQTHDRQTSVPIATLTVITRFSDVLRLQAYRDYLPNLFVVNQIQCKALKRVDQAPDAYFPLFLSGRFFLQNPTFGSSGIYGFGDLLDPPGVWTAPLGS